jgi:hypothetical protein
MTVATIKIQHPKENEAVKTSFIAQGTCPQAKSVVGFLWDGKAGFHRGMLRVAEGKTGKERWNLIFIDVPEGNHWLFVMSSEDTSKVESVRVTVAAKKKGNRADQVYGDPEIGWPGNGAEVASTFTAYGTSGDGITITGTMKKDNGKGAVSGTASTSGEPGAWGGFWFIDFSGVDDDDPYELKVVDDQQRSGRSEDIDVD